jgi:hypothetical protein
MELLWAKRKDANSVPESCAPFHGALTEDNVEARSQASKACGEIRSVSGEGAPVWRGALDYEK